MDVVSNSYMPGDPRLIDHIVYELKAQGIFDNFRKECIADVDTKPAYQNLRQRVEGSVVGFLKTQQWRPDMNKNQVREMLRKNISESGFLETGVERIVDQVVNPKINTIFLPQVENVVYKVLGIHKPSTFDELKSEKNLKNLDANSALDMSDNNLLPSDLEAVSPESEPQDRKLDVSNESQKFENSRIDDDESPPFEPLEESSSFMVQEDNSVDSHLSGFSGLASHDSNHSFEVANKITPMEISNQDSQFSKQSSDDHLSIVMFDETDTKMEANEDSSQSKISKTTDSNSKSFDFMQENQASSDKGSQSSFKPDKKDVFKTVEDKCKVDEKKTEKRSSDKHRPRNDSKSEIRDRKNEKDKKLDRDKKERRDKSKSSSRDAKDKDKDKKDSKSKGGSESKTDKEHRHEKDRDKSKNSGSRHGSSSSKDRSSSKKDSAEIKTKEKPKESESKDSRTTELDTKTKDSEPKDPKIRESKTKDTKVKSESSRSRDDSKSRTESKSHSSTRSKSDSKNHSKHNGKNKGDSSDVDKCASKSSKKEEKSSKKDDKHHSRSEKYSSTKRDEKRDRDKKDPKKDIKKMIKDDHYGLKGKASSRRSTDRDSSDGHSGTHSSSSSFAESSASSQLQKTAQDGSAINSRSNSGDSGNSEQVDSVLMPTESLSVQDAQMQESATAHVEQLPQVKLIKPKFASNIFEARRLMKIRKKLGKIEKQSQMGLIKAGVTLKNPTNAPVNDGRSDSILTYEIVTVPDDPDINDGLKQKPNILKKTIPSILSSSESLKFRTTQQYRNKNKLANHQKKSSEPISGRTKTVFDRRAESEEENFAEVVEISASDDITSAPLQNSVISKESWDAVEAKLLENVMKSDYRSYSNPFEHLSHKEISAVQSLNDNGAVRNDDCLGLSQEVTLETQKYLEVVRLFMHQLEDDIEMKESLLNKPYAQQEAATTTNPIDGFNRRLPKVAIVDVTSDSEIVISPSKGVKRHASDHHNNNIKKTTRLEEDQLNHTVSKVSPSTKPNASFKAKKAKVVDNTVNHLDTFNLPLSPAESDKSFTITSDKKNEKDDPKVKRNSNITRAIYNSCNQRYSTDDLYKPRLQFSSSRRRAAKSRDTN